MRPQAKGGRTTKTVRQIIISIHPDDHRSDSVREFLRIRFPEIRELELRFDPSQTRPRAIAIDPEDAISDLITIDSALFRQFSQSDTSE
jgi:hypothetical protein